MTDRTTEVTEIQYKAAHKANKKIADQEGGSALLSSNLGASVINEFEDVEKLKKENVRDPLTGAFNRRYLEKEFKNIKNNEEVTVVVVDIDEFKQWNDKYGHRMGDKFLINTTRIFNSNLQIVGNGTTDVVVRYGGDEFVLVLKHFSDRDAVVERIEGIRTTVESSFVKDKEEAPGYHATISSGIAIRKPGEHMEDLLHRADEALYQAKEKGRNRVEVAD